MGSVYSDQDHHGNRILNADLTQIDPSSLHPDVLTVDEVVAGAGILVTPDAGGVVVSVEPSAPSSYRERFTVADPGAQEPLVVNHNLGATVVSVTVAEIGTPTEPVAGQVTFIDENTVEVLLTGESAGEFEVLVLTDGGTSGGGDGTTGEYLPLSGGALTGGLGVTGSLSVMRPDSPPGLYPPSIIFGSGTLGESGYEDKRLAAAEIYAMSVYISAKEYLRIQSDNPISLAAVTEDGWIKPNILTNLAPPKTTYDAANKKYVDDSISTAIAPLIAKIDELTTEVAALRAKTNE